MELNDKLERKDYKLLEVIDNMNQLGLYPTPLCVYQLLTGDVDDELLKFSNLVGFATFHSTNTKRVKNRIIWLVRYGLVKYVYNKETDSSDYLELTPKGLNELKEYRKKYKYPFHKPKKVNKNITYYVSEKDWKYLNFSIFLSIKRIIINKLDNLNV